MTRDRQSENCSTMAEVRRRECAGRHPGATAGERSGYMTQAATVKNDEALVRDEAASRPSSQGAAPGDGPGRHPDLIERLYRAMMEATSPTNTRSWPVCALPPAAQGEQRSS
jgi:isochorismate pyruvate lyase